MAEAKALGSTMPMPTMKGKIGARIAQSCKTPEKASSAPARPDRQVSSVPIRIRRSPPSLRLALPEKKAPLMKPRTKTRKQNPK